MGDRDRLPHCCRLDRPGLGRRERLRDPAGRSDLPHLVGAALSKSGLDARRLEIEVTESVFINDGKQAIKVLRALRAQGVSISLDDFGTGYSSLSYLRCFAFNKIKIDKPFMVGLGQGGEAGTIARAIIGLGHDLAASIVAEGIEIPGQLSIVRGEGCVCHPIRQIRTRSNRPSRS